MNIWKSRHFQIGFILWLVGLAFSATIAQWLHELGHVVMALLTGASIKEVQMWPPWQGHVTAVYHSPAWFLGGFLFTAIPFLYFFVFLCIKKSQWAYVLIFPLFQTVPSSQGDLGALGFFISFEVLFLFAWVLPTITFVLFFIAVEKKSKQQMQKLAQFETSNMQV